MKNKTQMLKAGKKKQQIHPSSAQNFDEPNTEEYGDNLIGSKVKVWWPVDQMFYDGIVESYDAVKKTHKIVYTDGDVEILDLKNEKWEFIEDASKSEDSTVKEYGNNLVGLMIKVWWPIDSMYYDGIVQSYDDVKKTHKILYTDGDVEILNLTEEKWEVIPDAPESKEANVKEYGNNLVGLKIKVWWPQDIMYYDAVVKSYDAKKKKHRIVYTDDDVEMLDLKKEKWEVIKDATGSEEVPHMTEYGHDLVGLKIRVWWPLELKYYDAIVESYDAVKKKHKILYTDGDVDVLNLKRQKWEFIEDDLEADDEASQVSSSDLDAGASSSKSKAEGKSKKRSKAVGKNKDRAAKIGKKNLRSSKS